VGNQKKKEEDSQSEMEMGRKKLSQRAIMRDIRLMNGRMRRRGVVGS
jgi:hypothetical protein